MRYQILLGLFIALPHMSWAQPLSLQINYEQEIRTYWPHASLRLEQRQWLAQQSLTALKTCHETGASLAWCQQQVRDGLRELIGSEPVAQGQAGNQQRDTGF